MTSNTTPGAVTRRPLLNPREAAARAGISQWSITRAARAGDLHAVRVGPGQRSWRIPEESLERWLGLDDAEGPAT